MEETPKKDVSTKRSCQRKGDLMRMANEHVIFSSFIVLPLVALVTIALRALCND